MGKKKENKPVEVNSHDQFINLLRKTAFTILPVSGLKIFYRRMSSLQSIEYEQSNKRLLDLLKYSLTDKECNNIYGENDEDKIQELLDELSVGDKLHLLREIQAFTYPTIEEIEKN